MREKTYGVVDIGSNTVHLLVARTDGQRIEPIVDESEGLRLGFDVDSQGRISALKLKELILTLRRFQDSASKAGVKNLHLLATHAVRAAENGKAVCATILKKTGLPVQMLPPEQEAALAFLGAQAACPSIGPQVMVDIGGGSMQVAVGERERVWDSVSLPLGASRVAYHFLESDPPTSSEIYKLVNYLVQVVPPALPLRGTNLSGMLAVGGTARRIRPILGITNGQVVKVEALEAGFALLSGKQVDKIGIKYALRPERARLMLPWIMLIREVMRGYDDPPLIIAPYGVREGAILWLARHGEM